MAKPGWGTAASLVVLMATGPAWPAASATVPDVVVFCDPALTNAVTDLGEAFRAHTKVPVRIFPTTSAAQIASVARGDRADVLVLQGAVTVDDAVRRGLIAAPPRMADWRNRLVLARIGQGAGGAGELAAVLRQGNHLAIVDAAVDPLGEVSLEALQSAQFQVPVNTIGVVGTADADFLLIHGSVGVALITTADLAADPVLGVAAAVPDGYYKPITSTIAINTKAESPNTQAFADFLRSPQARARLPALGLEAIP